MAYAVLGVLVGLNLASTAALAWFAWKFERAFVAQDARLSTLESRRVPTHSSVEPAESAKIKVRPRSMTEVREDLERKSAEVR